MEWVETTAKTVEEAKELALDRLGVADEDAEFEILEEPRPGLFGRVRGEARVRARVRPTRPRAKVERRDRRRRSDKAAADAATNGTGGSETGSTETGATETGATRTGGTEPEPASAAEGAADVDAPGEASARRGSRRKVKTRADQAPQGDPGEDDIVTDERGDEQEVADVAAAATAFVTGIVTAFGLDATVGTELRDGEIEVLVDGDDVGMLIGPRGATMTALQDLTRAVAQRRLGPGSPRLLIDVGRYRQRRHEALRRFVVQVADEVRESGQARALEPMAPADRKVIHDTVNELPGVATTSEGEEPFRRVVVVPGDG